MKLCIRCGGSMEGEPNRAKVCLECKGAQKEKQGPPTPKKVEGDRIPNINFLPKARIYAYPIGIRGYRFTLIPNSGTVWTRDSSGIEAAQFLREIKRKNRNGRLEALFLPE